MVFHQIHAPSGTSKTLKELDMAIADMSRTLYPDMAIIDGTIGMEGLGPGAGYPKGAGLVVVSMDALAADWTACQLMGIEPNQVAHLRLIAGARGFDPSTIACSPKDFGKWITPFARPPEKISFRYPGVKVHDRESCSACQNTLYLFLDRFHHRLRPILDRSGPLHLAMGKGVDNLPKGTICIGNCCFHLAETTSGIAVPGCPPVASQIWEKVQTLDDLCVEHDAPDSPQFF
jgi:hypothetical protein